MRNTAIIGLARTGIACAKVLLERGNEVTVYDSKTDGSAQQEADRLRALGAQVVLGTDLPSQEEPFTLFIVSPGIKPWHPIFENAQERNIPVWSEIEVAYRIAQARMIAVTGTNGKSTTCALIHHLLKSAGIKAWLCGNLAGSENDMPLITAAHQAQADEWLVAEVSSFQLMRTEQFRPRIGVLTNLRNDHLDYHGSWEDYAQAKARLFQAQTAENWLVMNKADAGTQRLLQVLKLRGEDRALNALQSAGHLIWIDQANHPQVETIQGALSPALPGSHNLQNALMAVACAEIAGIPFEVILSGLRSYPGLPHRMEFVAEKRGVCYINNSMCTNADALRASLSSLPHPPIAIIGGYDKNQDGGSIAEIAAEHCKAVLVIGTQVDLLLSRLQELGMGEYVETLGRAVARASETAKTGDTVILAPAFASFDQFVDFIDRGEQFKKLVRQL